MQNSPRRLARLLSRGISRVLALGLLAVFATAPRLTVAGQPNRDIPLSNAPAGGGTASSTPADNSADAGEEVTVSKRSLFGIIREGAGPLIIPLLLCSFVLLVFTFERTISLRMSRVIPGPFVKRFLHQLQEGQLDREQAAAICAENGSPIAKIFGAASKKWGKSAVEVEQALIDAGDRAGHELRRYLRVFNGVATVSPMFGLLGTVAGMIQAFSDISSSHAMGKPELLAKGISEALVMTGMGLTVAIPALILYWTFAGMVDRLIVRIDLLGQDVVGAISAEALQEAAKARGKRSAA
ncbi:MAG TPA: MotA/TolQ/ExbB proton channel family protein [Pirellulales bacterium]|nr:MotA/TolQ/ExbB proton channel family protein [Pirellulales bacterium]